MNAQEWIDKHGSAEAALVVALNELEAAQYQIKRVQAQFTVVQRLAQRLSLYSNDADVTR